jgi:hypothetical protein
LGEDIDVELLHQNRTVLSTEIENGENFHTIQYLGVYTIIITLEGEGPVKEQIELMG